MQTIATENGDLASERTTLRAREIFLAYHDSIIKRTDKLFIWLMALQFVAGIAVTLWLSPYTWTGSYRSVHIHVWAAIVIGGALSAYPIFLALKQPGTVLTRHTIAIAQVLWSALLIHLTGGRIETHFHVFGSLAILAFYRDWRVLVSASAVVFVDHLLRGIYAPQSVYGVLSAPLWRAFEHAGWVIFEDTFLILSIRHGLKEIFNIAEQQANLENLNEIVERKVVARTEELHQQRAFLRQVIDLVPNFIFAKDRQGRFTLVNQATAEAYGTTVEGLLGKSDADFNPNQQEVEHFLRDDNAVMDSGCEKIIPEERITDSTGKTRWLLTIKRPIVSPDGKAYQVLGVSSDISERKKAEETIREQASLLDITHDAILVCSLTDMILFWNKGAERVYGWTASEVQGRNISDLYVIDTSSYMERKRRVMENGEWIGEINQRTKEGKEVLVLSRQTLMVDSEGIPKSILVVNTDITEKKKLEDQFLRSQRMQSIGTLAGGIAHDLNNVLSPIVMSVDMLRRDLPANKRLMVLDTLSESAQRGAGIIKQVLSFARGFEGEKSLIQVKHLIAEFEKIIKDTFPRSIELRTAVLKQPWVVSGDPTQLYQVLMNLSVNARDAMPNGGVLTIEVSNTILDEHSSNVHIDAMPGPYVILSVSDTGMGIPKNVIDKIFDPFFTTKEVGKGTGLGLSTVIGIVKSHGGFVNVYSELKKGTRFKVYLPASESSDVQRAIQEQNDLPRGQGELVLVVDDEAAIRTIQQNTLEANGYRVITACDGTEAIAIFAKEGQNIQLVVTDMMMPYLDGNGTIRALRKLAPEMKFIAVSGLVGDKHIEDLVADNKVVFIQKPYTAQSLLRTMKTLLTRN